MADDLEDPKPGEPKPGEEPDKEPEGTTEVQGQKLVPLAALHEEREKRKLLSKEVADLKTKAERLATVEQHLETLQPTLRLIEQHPDLVEKLTKASKPGEEQPEDDPDAEETARDLGLYTESGELDVKRAQRLMKRIETRTEKIAGKKVEEGISPIRDSTTQERAGSLRQQAYSVKDDSGRSYAKREHIDKLLDALPASLQADKRVVQIVLAAARGIGGVPSSTEEPQLSEPAGGRRPGGRTMSPLEEKAAAARGITPDKWRTLTDDKTDVLE